MNGDDLWFQVRRMINEYEQARDPDASEIGRQFAVGSSLLVLKETNIDHVRF